VKFHPRIASKIAGAADELLMNAIFDAPTDAEGKSIFGDDAHSKDIPLDGKHSVEMQVGFDGKYAAVLVSDHFGSLDPPRLLEKLAQNYSEEEYVPSEGWLARGWESSPFFTVGEAFSPCQEERAHRRPRLLPQHRDLP